MCPPQGLASRRIGRGPPQTLTSRAEAKQRSLAVLVRDFTIYVLVGLVVVALTLFYAIRAPAGSHLDLRWVGLFGGALFTFGYPLGWYWRRRRRYCRAWQFWCAFASLVAGYFIFFIWALTTIEDFKLLWFPILTPVEWTLIYPVLEWSGRIGNASHKEEPSRR
jgi:hypothetical protein